MMHKLSVNMAKHSNEFVHYSLSPKHSFVEDVSKRMKQMIIQHLLGLKKFFSIYLDTGSNTEPQLLATPKLSSLLHTYLF